MRPHLSFHFASRFKQLRADALMLPWFALCAINRRTGPGIWKQRGTRSQTQLAHGRFRTPPTRIYTTKTRCPCSGGLLRIHSRASTSVFSFCKSASSSWCRYQLMLPWFAPLAINRQTGPGIWNQRGTRSQTQLAHGRSRTPPTRIYTMKTRCPCSGGLLRIHSRASTSVLSFCKSLQAAACRCIDAPMVCPARHQQTNRARNMEAAWHKEPNSTCPRSV